MPSLSGPPAVTAHRHVLGFSDPQGQLERALVAGREAPVGVVGDDAGQWIGLGPQVDPLEEGGNEGAGATSGAPHDDAVATRADSSR